MNRVIQSSSLCLLHTSDILLLPRVVMARAFGGWYSAPFRKVTIVQMQGNLHKAPNHCEHVASSRLVQTQCVGEQTRTPC